MKTLKGTALLLLAAALGGLLYLGGTGKLKNVPWLGKFTSESSRGTGRHEGHPVEQGAATGGQEAGQAEEEAPAVEISPDMQQLLGVRTTEVALEPLQKIIRTVGRVDYDERNRFTVNAKFEGWIEKLNADYTGKYVRKGEPLAEIYSPELLATQQELLNALRWMQQGADVKDPSLSSLLRKDAASLAEAARRRLALWDISADQIRAVEETGSPMRTLVVHSPVSGYVVQKMAVQGMRVMPGEKLLDIADLSSLWVTADVYENEVPLVTLGQRAKITMTYLPGKELTAVIDYVYPVLSGETRTAKVRFTVPNPDGRLKPEMFTNVEITIPLGRRLAVPSEAVLDTGTRQVVYVDKGDGFFEPREVKIGLKVDGMQEVLSGLRRGEKIAASAIFLIDSEAQLKGVTPLGGHSH